MNSISARERRLIAILILIGLTAFAWLGVISPVVSGFTARAEQREDLQQQFARNERQIAAITRLRKAVEAQRRGDVDFRTTGATAEDATEALKERVTDVVVGQGGELRAVQDVGDEPGWARIWVEAKMSLPQMTTTLTKLQNQTPFLAVNGVTIAADRALQSGDLDILDVRIEVSSPIAITQSG